MEFLFFFFSQFKIYSPSLRQHWAVTGLSQLGQGFSAKLTTWTKETWVPAAWRQEDPRKEGGGETAELNCYTQVYQAFLSWEGEWEEVGRGQDKLMPLRWMRQG